LHFTCSAGSLSSAGRRDKYFLVCKCKKQCKIDKAPIPEGLKGAGIIFITIGLMAMAFIGFSGMLPVQ
jgi:Na+-transporting NADH:ubiquinone oxidoreductase subunit NqrE